MKWRGVHETVWCETQVLTAPFTDWPWELLYQVPLWKWKWSVLALLKKLIKNYFTIYAMVYPWALKNHWLIKCIPYCLKKRKENGNDAELQKKQRNNMFANLWLKTKVNSSSWMLFVGNRHQMIEVLYRLGIQKGTSLSIIKGVYIKSITNINLNRKKHKAVPLKLGTRQDFPLFP